MSVQWISKWVIAVVASVALNGCLMRQTVTSGGEVVKDDYVVKRPLKDARQSAE